MVLYTEKMLAYFIVGTIDGSVKRHNVQSRATVTLPAPADDQLHAVGDPSEPLPSSGSFKIYLGTDSRHHRSRK